MYPIITIVGRPNVGKSTIFNKLVGKRLSVVSEVAGTTRDRVCMLSKINGYNVMVVDTGGLEIENEGDIESNVKIQAKIGIKEADLVLFVVDSKNELTTEDYHVIEILRKEKKKCLLIANKCDNSNIKDNAVELYRLGLDDPCFASAIHNLGFDELNQRIISFFKKNDIPINKRQKIVDEKMINICFVGKPNVGKSSLVNAICGENRLIVSDKAGTTRDSTDTQIIFEKNKFNLIDTAGLRRRGKIEKGIEKYSVLRTFQALQRSDIGLLIIDYEEGITKQDLHLAGYITDETKGLIIVVNKSDLIEEAEEEQRRFINKIRYKFPFLPWAPVVFTSAINKKNITKIMELAIQIKEERKKRIPTAKMNLFAKKVQIKHPPTLPSKKWKTPGKIYYLSQTTIEPPQFVFIVNEPQKFHFSYKRYLENQLRDAYGFVGTSIDLVLRKKSRKDKIEF
ncbi:ribosome biogenesis GTPase Der [Patescibacteria group bacterium]|nr:ribosome biogenesis GTPase Der [Patescibacteria group bacterium]